MNLNKIKGIELLFNFNTMTSLVMTKYRGNKLKIIVSTVMASLSEKNISPIFTSTRNKT